MLGSKKKNSIYICVSAYLLHFMTPANAVVLLESDTGWRASVNGSLPVFFVNSDFDSGESASRIQSGFNPASLTFHVNAPKTSDVIVSAHVQYNTHLQGSQIQNSGLFESRIAEIQIDGDLGRLNIGKGFGIFNSTAIADTASSLGVGLLGAGADTANATGGRIGAGYVYTNFNPRMMYTSPNLNGAKIKVGLFNPEEPTDAIDAVETNTPRIEAQIDYTTNFTNTTIKLWSGFLSQRVKLSAEDITYEIQAYDIGIHLDINKLGFTFSYTDTLGIGADGLYGIGGVADADVNGSQWYIEADYILGKTTIGVSYGEGDQATHRKPFYVPEINNKLGMIFFQHQYTDNLTIMLEYQDYQSSSTIGDYKAYIIGTQFDF